MGSRERRTIWLVVLAVVTAGTVTGVVAGTGPAMGAADAGGAGSGTGRMMLVLDSSGSMKEPAAGGTTKIAAAKKALDQVVAGLPEEAVVGMRVYGATVFSKADAGACQDSQQVVAPGTGNREQLRSGIAKYKPYGETPTGYALREAAKDLGSEGRRSIVLVSDGEATCAPDPCVVASELAQQGINLHIDVVGLGVSGKARQQLQCVAAKGNGTYYGVDSADQIVSSLSRVARRDVRPFTLEGTPIQGSPDPAKPTPIAQGVWTDTVPPKKQKDNTLHYVYTRTMANSTVHVSAISTGQPDSWDGIEVDLTAPDGTRCDSANDIRTIDHASVLGAEALSQDTANTACATSKKLDVAVLRWGAWATQAAPVQLLVAEEPPADDLAALPTSDARHPTASPNLGGATTPVEGGTSFPDATEVGSGNYSGTTVPGETSVFKVHLDWGQRLAVRFDFPKGTPALYRITGSQGPFATIRIFDPLRAGIKDLIANAKDTDFATGSQPGHVIAGTYPVRYRNRSIAGNYSALAGDYYVELGVRSDPEHGAYELPYTMHLEVVGKPAGGPAYTGDRGWTVDRALATNASETASGSTTPATTAGTPVSAQAAPKLDDGNAGKYLVAGGLGVVAICCAAAGVLMLRRRSG